MRSSAYDVAVTTLESAPAPTGAGLPAAPKALAWLFTLAGAVALIAAFTLSVEKVKLLLEPDYVPSCNFSAVLSCTNIMKTDQASVFGFPNPFMGLIGFAVVVTLGVVLLSGVRLPEWMWVGTQIGMTFGAGFIVWLQYESLYVIGSLCPWCMVVWAMMLPLFWYTTVRNLGAWLPGNRVAGFVRDWNVLILALWYVAIIAAIFFRFYA